MDIASLGRGAGFEHWSALSFREHASLARFDALFIDLDAVMDEYSHQREALGDGSLLDVAGSFALLADARRWRAALADYVLSERIIVVGWRHLTAVRVHTIHGIVRFGLEDLFPLAEPRLERFAGEEEGAVIDCGEPFAQFLATVGVPQTVHTRVGLSRGETLLRSVTGAPAAAYRLIHAAHLILVPIPDDPNRRLRVDAAIRQVSGALCRARHSRFLPAWAAAIELPGEAQLRARLEALEGEIQGLKLCSERTRSELEALHALKAIVGGSPVQAAEVAQRHMRKLGANLLRDFEDDSGFVVGLDRGCTVLVAFAARHEAASGADAFARIESMRQRYQHEFDASAHPLLIVQAQPETAAEAARPDSEDTIVVRDARAFLDMLLRSTPTLTDRLAAFLSPSRES